MGILVFKRILNIQFLVYISTNHVVIYKYTIAKGLNVENYHRIKILSVLFYIFSVLYFSFCAFIVHSKTLQPNAEKK
jgi:hypothetical protein